MTIAAGIDVGTGTVKAALFRVEDGGEAAWLSRAIYRIRQRDPMELARVAFDEVLAGARVSEGDVDYVATTGEGEGVRSARDAVLDVTTGEGEGGPFHNCHLYSLTTTAGGAIYVAP